MKIIRYNVCLHRLEVHHLELLRYWRNNRYISQYMEYKEHITESMQREWFEKVDNICNFYFIIEYNDTPIGLINTSNINWEDGVADTGLFVWDDGYINSPVPVLASLGMLDVFFRILGLHKVTAKVKNDNTRAINYNASLGYLLVSDLKNTGFSLYELNTDRYFKHSAGLRKAAETLYNNKTEIYLSIKEELGTSIFDVVSEVSENKKQNLNLFLYKE